MKHVLADTCIFGINHPYSLDFTPCYFYLYPKVLGENTFLSCGIIKNNNSRFVEKRVMADLLKHFFEYAKACLQRHVDRVVDHVYEKISFCESHVLVNNLNHDFLDSFKSTLYFLNMVSISWGGTLNPTPIKLCTAAQNKLLH